MIHSNSLKQMRAHFITLCILLALPFVTALTLPAAGLEVAFDAANKLYEEGKYENAASAYEELINQGNRSDILYFNLGIAQYKAGKMGRAIAAFRLAEQLNPRDASLKANLQFARKKVNGEDKTVVPFWESTLALLTINEWSLLTAFFFWILFLLLALKEWKPSLAKATRSTLRTALLLTVVFGACLAGSLWLKNSHNPAVVVSREAVVRFGPLDEAKTAFTLADGAEVDVLDTKNQWVQVKDLLSKRQGWIKQDQLQNLSPAAHALSPQS